MKTERPDDQEKPQPTADGQGAVNFLRRNGSLILLAIVAAAAAFFIARNRTDGAADRRNASRNSLAAASDGVMRLRSLESLAGRLPAEQYASQRDLLSNSIRTAVEEVLKNTDASDASARSAALASRADLNWTMATLPVPPEATTREALRPVKAEKDYLDEAKGDWALILKQFPGEPAAVADARFGLAAVAEDRGDFDAAAEQYKAVATDKSAVPMHKTEAERRLKLLPDLRNPVRFGTPATLPAFDQPTTLPTSQPSSQPTSRPTSRATTMP